jgi:hypothetical protein
MNGLLKCSADILVCCFADFPVGSALKANERWNYSGAPQVGKPAIQQTGMSALQAARTLFFSRL